MQFNECHLLVLVTATLFGCGPTSAGPDSGASATVDASLASIDANDASQTIDAGKTDAASDATVPALITAYYYGDMSTPDSFSVVGLDVAQGISVDLALSGFSGKTDISGIAVSPDGDSIAVSGTDGADDAPELHIYPADGSGDPVVLFVAEDSSRSISNPAFSPDGNWLAFRTDSEIVGATALHVVPTDASAGAKRVSLTPVSSSHDVVSFLWANDSAHLAFVGDLENNGDDALWTVDAMQISPTPIAIVTSAEVDGRDVARQLAFDSTDRVYFRANFEASIGLFRIYRAALDGTGRTQVPGTALTHSSNTVEASTGSFGMSPDGEQIAFASESPEESLYQVYVLDVSTSAPALVSAVTSTVPLDGRTGPNDFADMIAWSPDGTQLAMAADWPVAGLGADNDFGVFVMPASGAPGGVRLATPQVSSGDAFAPLFFGSSHLLFRGDLITNNQNSLYLTGDLASPDQPASLILVDGGGVRGVAVSSAQ